MTASWLGPQGADRTAARSQPWRRLHRKIDRWFQPRELILRADGRVSYLAISARQQKISFVFLLGFILWGGFATAGMIISNRQLAAERSELAAARLAYARVVDEAGRSYERLLAYARDIRASLDRSPTAVAPAASEPDGRVEASLPGELRLLALDLQGLMRRDGELTRTVAGLEGALEAARAESRAQSQARQSMALELDRARLSLAGELARMRRDLAIAEDRRQALAGQVLALQADLTEVQQQAAASSAASAQAEADLGRLAGQLAASQASREALTAEIALLERNLAAAAMRESKGTLERAAAGKEIARLLDELTVARGDQQRLAGEIDASQAERQALTDRVAALEQDLASAVQREAVGALDRESAGKEIVRLLGELDQTRDDNVRLLRQTADTRSVLARALGQRDALQATRQELSERIGTLEDELANIQSTQQTIVDRLASRAHAGIGEVEKTVAMTGVDVDLLLGRARRELAGGQRGGEGGPFVPVTASATASGKLAMASVASLDGEVGRLEALQLVLRTLPLAAPVDHYQLNSSFGIRRDPFNHRLAMHEGVDLGNARLSPVLATSPGVVVFAGWKGSYGRMVEIDHGLGVHTRYAHLARIDVKLGDAVDYRDQVGLLGSSGRSNGAHVHYEVRIDGRPLDPMNFLKAGRYVFKG